MSIVRARRNTNYTMLSNVGLEDERISWKAKGVLAFLLSKPDGWEVKGTHLASIGPDGVTATQAALRELEECGYLVRTQAQDERGRWIHKSFVFDEPQGQSIESAPIDAKTPRFSHVGNSHMGKSHVGKPNLLVSTEEASTETTNTEEDIPSGIASARQKPTRPRTRVHADTKEAPAHDAPTRERVHDKPPTEQQVFYGSLCAAVGWDYKTITLKERNQVAQAAGILSKAGYTKDDVERFIYQVWRKDWRWLKSKQLPTLSQLRAEIGKVKNATGIVESGSAETEEERKDREQFIQRLAENKRRREAGERGDLSGIPLQ